MAKMNNGNENEPDSREVQAEREPNLGELKRERDKPMNALELVMTSPRLSDEAKQAFALGWYRAKRERGLE